MTFCDGMEWAGAPGEALPVGSAGGGAAEAALPLGEVGGLGGPALPPPGLLPAGIPAVPLAVEAVPAEKEPPPALLAPDRPDDGIHALRGTARGSGRTRPPVRRCSRRSRSPVWAWSSPGVRSCGSVPPPLGTACVL